LTKQITAACLTIYKLLYVCVCKSIRTWVYTCVSGCRGLYWLSGL